MTELALAAIDPHKRQASMSKRSAVLMVAQLSTLISCDLLDPVASLRTRDDPGFVPGRRISRGFVPGRAVEGCCMPSRPCASSEPRPKASPSLRGFQHHRRPLHLSLDIDSADPVFAPGTGTTASGGLTPRELEYTCSDTNYLLCRSYLLCTTLLAMAVRSMYLLGTCASSSAGRGG